MSKKILILGRSGSGKSSSLRNFKEGEVGVISVQGKELPFRTDLAMYTPKLTQLDNGTVVPHKYAGVMAALKKAGQGNSPKVMVVDDAGYLMSDEFMKRSNEKGYDKFTQIADHFYTLLDEAGNLPDDVTVYFIMHTELDSDGYEKPKSIGKLLDEKIVIEGLFTTVLKATNTEGKYVFQTRTNGSDCVKSPFDMFKDAEVPNDLKLVDQTIREYYGMPIPYKTNKETNKEAGK